MLRRLLGKESVNILCPQKNPYGLNYIEAVCESEIQDLLEKKVIKEIPYGSHFFVGSSFFSCMGIFVQSSLKILGRDARHDISAILGVTIRCLFN